MAVGTYHLHIFLSKYMRKSVICIWEDTFKNFFKVKHVKLILPFPQFHYYNPKPTNFEKTNKTCWDCKIKMISVKNNTNFVCR